MSNINEVLSSSKIFASLEKKEMQKMEMLFDKRNIFPGDILTNKGETAQFFFLLHAGTLLLDMDDGKSVVLDTIGDFIGLELLSIKGLYKTDIIVLEKGSIFAISRQNFLNFIQQDSDGAAIVMKSWQEYLIKTALFAKKSKL